MYVPRLLVCTYTNSEEGPMATKIPTTYAGIQLGDVIDGETVHHIDSDDQGVRISTTSPYVSEDDFGPYTDPETPVSVYR
jgi:hypothetical protein